MLTWFDAHERDLPWRVGAAGGRDPYRVWVSEVLLQQTQVVRGRVYFERFLTAFPTVRDLADAPQEAVLKAWEGCGYYARARNLHAAAKVIAEAGVPTTYEGWRALPGVGPYTAAAVSSIAFGEARAVVDGNVRRVLARVFGEREPADAWVQAKADEVLARDVPGRWNEAVMDLGATVCVPGVPKCAACPLTALCAAFASGEPEAYPAPKKRPAVKEATFVAVVIGTPDAAYLERRGGTLLGGLSGLPAREVTTTEASALSELLCDLGASGARKLGTVTHAMTHRRLTWHVYAAHADLPRVKVSDAPLSNLDRKALALLNAPQASLFP